MTLIEKLWDMASSCNGVAPLLSDSWKNDIISYIKEEMDSLAKELKYDGWTYYRPVYEYPETIVVLAWPYVQKAVLKYLEENHPGAWFKPMYMSTEQQKALGLPV